MTTTLAPRSFPQRSLPGVSTPEPRLTDRQRQALEWIGAHQPVDHERLGAYLHQLRRESGGRGHSLDETCPWCVDEGKAMGAALRAKGFVTLKRDAGWALVGFHIPREARATDPLYGEIPF